MARVGFKKTWAEGTFDNLASQALFDHLKTYIINAGFNILMNAGSLDFIRAAEPAGTANDDVPHWALDSANGLISIYAVFGNTFLDQNAKTNSRFLVNFYEFNNQPPEITVRFAADGIAGWWWVHVISQGIQGNISVISAFTGTTLRRYPADYYQGICARYGMLDHVAGKLLLPYAITLGQNPVAQAVDIDIWSPLSKGERHPNSPLPRMAAPIYPNGDNSLIAACILGESQEALRLTDGYAQDETVMPGWIAMIGDNGTSSYAVPAPDQFDLL